MTEDVDQPKDTPPKVSANPINIIDCYVGEIRFFGGNYAPLGWALCDGSLLSVQKYPDLFSILGTQFGGDGVNTFGLPDFRGRVPVAAGLANTGTRYLLAQTGGSTTAETTEDNLPAHNHDGGITFVDVSLGASIQPAISSSPIPGALLATSNVIKPTKFTAKAYGIASNSVRLGGFDALDEGTGVSDSTGGGQVQNNMMPGLVVNPIIAIVGLYPPRS